MVGVKQEGLVLGADLQKTGGIKQPIKGQLQSFNHIITHHIIPIYLNPHSLLSLTMPNKVAATKKHPLIAGPLANAAYLC